MLHLTDREVVKKWSRPPSSKHKKFKNCCNDRQKKSSSLEFRASRKLPRKNVCFFPGTILFTLFFFLQNKYDITPAATNNNTSKAATMGMTAESGYT